MRPECLVASRPRSLWWAPLAGTSVRGSWDEGVEIMWDLGLGCVRDGPGERTSTICAFAATVENRER